MKKQIVFLLLTITLVNCKNVDAEKIKVDNPLEIQNDLSLFNDENGVTLFRCWAKKIIQKNIIDIKDIKEKELIDVSDYSAYFSQKTLKNIKEVFYLYSFDLPICNGVFYIKNNDGSSNLNLLYFNNNGSYNNKLLLSEINQDSPGLHRKFLSKIDTKNNTIVQYRVDSMVDVFNDENNYSENIDSVKTIYSIKKDKLQIKEVDSSRHYIVKGKI